MITNLCLVMANGSTNFKKTNARFRYEQVSVLNYISSVAYQKIDTVRYRQKPKLNYQTVYRTYQYRVSVLIRFIN